MELFTAKYITYKIIGKLVIVLRYKSLHWNIFPGLMEKKGSIPAITTAIGVKLLIIFYNSTENADTQEEEEEGRRWYVEAVAGTGQLCSE